LQGRYRQLAGGLADHAFVTALKSVRHELMYGSRDAGATVEQVCALNVQSAPPPTERQQSFALVQMSHVAAVPAPAPPVPVAPPLLPVLPLVELLVLLAPPAPVVCRPGWLSCERRNASSSAGVIPPASSDAHPAMADPTRTTLIRPNPLL
jgi:hypothetical protein